MSHFVEVLECPPPNLTPLLAVYQKVFEESLSTEQDRATLTPAERFAAVVTSLRRGASTREIDPAAWDQHTLTVVVAAELPHVLALVELVGGAHVAMSPFDQARATIALITAKAPTWRDSVSAGVSDERKPLAAIFGDLYRGFCVRGYAALWRDYTARHEGKRLLLERK